MAEGGDLLARCTTSMTSGSPSPGFLYYWRFCFHHDAECLFIGYNGLKTEGMEEKYVLFLFKLTRAVSEDTADFGGGGLGEASNRVARFRDIKRQ